MKNYIAKEISAWRWYISLIPYFVLGVILTLITPGLTFWQIFIIIIFSSSVADSIGDYIRKE